METLTHLKFIYGEDQEALNKHHQPRYNNLVHRFKTLYNKKPDFFARAPGRVNLIGEHIDYSGYAVLPACLEQDFVMAVSIEDSEEIEINNIDKDQFEAAVLSTDPHQKFREEIHWSHYFLCGYKAITTLWKE